MYGRRRRPGAYIHGRNGMRHHPAPIGRDFHPTCRGDILNSPTGQALSRINTQLCRNSAKTPVYLEMEAKPKSRKFGREKQDKQTKIEAGKI
jgi:hypothetical protein